MRALKFERPDYQTLTGAIGDLKSAETFLKGYQLPPQQMQQLHNLQTVISALQTRQCMRPLTHERTKNYSQFQLSNLLFAYLCQQSLPT